MFSKESVNFWEIIQRIRSLAPADRGLVLWALLLLGFIRLGLRFLRFQRLQAILAILSCPVAPAQQISVYKLVWSVTTASGLMPNVKCLARALAAQTLLRRQGYEAELKLGVAKASKALLAHAWIELGGRVVMGGIGNSVKRYQPLTIPEDGRFDIAGLGL